jgi:hypothetical protein
MALPYPVYSKTLKDDFKQLSFEKLLFLGSWCCEYLNNKYGSFLDELGYVKEHQILSDIIAFLWDVVDNPSVSSVDETTVKKQMKNLQKMDMAYAFDFAKPKDCGVLKLMEGVERVLNYLKKKNPDDILACAYYPVDVLNAVMNSKLDPYTTPDKSTIDDPFFKEELDAQRKLLVYLKEHEKVTSADKHIFR